MDTRALRSRHLILFGAAVGLPCLLLVGLSLRMLSQERELAQKRLADSRRAAAADVRQSLLSRLERLRRDAVAGAPSGGAVALVGVVEGARLVLPWDQHATTAAVAAALADPVFAEAIRAGERSELVDRQYDAAVTSYRRAAAVAQVPSQTALTDLLLARTLAKAGQPAAAAALHRRLLALRGDVVDEHGVPFALYAARRTLDAAPVTSDLRAVIDAVRTACLSTPLVPAAHYMCGDLGDALGVRAQQSDAQAVAAVAQELSSRRADLELALSLQRDVATVLARARAAAVGDDPAWVPFGPPTSAWLVTFDGPGSRLVAVRAAPVLEALGSVRIDGAGEPLGAGLPGLVATFDAAQDAAPAGLQRRFFLTALALVVGMTMFGGYLFWRDIRREVDLAAMRTQFVSSVSHELKTPLTAIRMFAETLLLNRSTRPDTAHEYLETIINESERLTRLLNNVLDFSQIEQGQKVYRLERHALPAIVRTAVRAMEYPFLQQGFSLRLAIDETVPPVASDPDAMQQAVLNLLSNAMKYSGASRVVHLTLSREGQEAVISVADGGLGIPAAEHRRIFDKFYRVGGADRERIAGTGLGLTLVDHIVRGHGGTVTVRSTPGSGSTFSIRLPIVDVDGAAPSAARALA